MKLNKGQNTRQIIIDKARHIFNENGLNITLEMIAANMGLTKSRITNHFATKESLFLAILRDYENVLARVAGEIKLADAVEFSEIAGCLSVIMDVQYEYRCGMAYITLVTQSQHELHKHISENYERNVRNIFKRVEKMVSRGILKSDILIKYNFNTFVFQYTNLLTTWVINLILYDYEKGYAKMKPLYLYAALSCYKPYLTSKGEQEIATLDFRSISKKSLSMKSKSLVKPIGVLLNGSS